MVNIVQLLDELSYDQYTKHINDNRQDTNMLLMQPILDDKVDHVWLAADNCNELRTCNLEELDAFNAMIWKFFWHTKHPIFL